MTPCLWRGIAGNHQGGMGTPRARVEESEPVWRSVSGHSTSTSSLRSGRCDFVDLVQNGYGARPVAPLQGSLERRSAPSPTVSRRRIHPPNRFSSSDDALSSRKSSPSSTIGRRCVPSPSMGEGQSEGAPLSLTLSCTGSMYTEKADTQRHRGAECRPSIVAPAPVERVRGLCRSVMEDAERARLGRSLSTSPRNVGANPSFRKSRPAHGQKLYGLSKLRLLFCVAMNGRYVTRSARLEIPSAQCITNRSTGCGRPVRFSFPFLGWRHRTSRTVDTEERVSIDEQNLNRSLPNGSVSTTRGITRRRCVPNRRTG